jgi:hypothetical protein
MWKSTISGALLVSGLLFGASAAIPNNTWAGDAGAQVKQDVKKGARVTTEKTEEAGGAVKRGTKKGARATAQKTEEAGGAVKRGVQKTGGKIKDVFKP